MGNEPAKVNVEDSDTSALDTESYKANHNEKENLFDNGYFIGGMVFAALFILFIISVIAWCCCRISDKLKKQKDDLQAIDENVDNGKDDEPIGQEFEEETNTVQ